MRTVVNNLDTSDVGFPGPVGLSVRVRYVAAEGNALSADFTFCHCLHLLMCLIELDYHLKSKFLSSYRTARIIIAPHVTNCKCFFAIFTIFFGIYKKFTF